jgi:hypothetical protein
MDTSHRTEPGPKNSTLPHRFSVHASPHQGLHVWEISRHARGDGNRIPIIMQSRLGRALCGLYQTGKDHEITAQSSTFIVIRIDFDDGKLSSRDTSQDSRTCLQVWRTIVSSVEILLSTQRSSLVEDINDQDQTLGIMTYYTWNNRNNRVTRGR